MGRAYLIIGALVWASLLAILIEQPGYTDSYYYFNAGQRFAEGNGLTDPYLWNYINAPDELPGPSHTYWMPLESLIAAVSMTVFGAHFGAAQVPSVLCFAGLALVGFWVGGRLGGTRRHAWISALLVMFSGFFTPFWTTTDTFALYGLVGAVTLVTLGLGRETGNWRWYAASGLSGGLAHLTRADGVLFLVALLIVVLWPRPEFVWRRAMMNATVGLIAYLLVMAPWFARNLSEIGTPLPVGGMDTIWLRGYNELFNYPPGASAEVFLNWGVRNILQSRWEALSNNLGTFVAVETWIVLGPFTLAGLWSRRRDPFLAGVIWYALGLHLAMTFVFAYPGYRGGLFHSSSALLPFWASLGLVGLDDGITWMAQRRRWRRQEAQVVFSGALVILAVLLSAGIFFSRLAAWNNSDSLRRDLAQSLPDGAVVMINDPASLYYHTGLYGVSIPNTEPDVVPEIAARYGVTYLVLDQDHPQSFTALFLGEAQFPFLRPYALDGGNSSDDYQIFEIVVGEQRQ